MLARFGWVTLLALSLGACGVQQGGVCQYRPNVAINGMDCAGGLVCCVDRPVLGERGLCQPAAMCQAIRSDASIDASMLDSGTVDSGIDSSVPDAGTDAGSDAGTMEDAGTDAGSTDDAGLVDDAGP